MGNALEPTKPVIAYPICEWYVVCPKCEEHHEFDNCAQPDGGPFECPGCGEKFEVRIPGRG